MAENRNANKATRRNLVFITQVLGVKEEVKKGVKEGVKKGVKEEVKKDK